MPPTLCVVLNNQHQKRVDDFAQRCASQEARMLFQPYTDKHLKSLRRLDDEGKLPVPIYLVSGQYGSMATVVGDLVKVEYSEEIPKHAFDPLKELLPVTDTTIYGKNLLYLAHARRLRTPIAVDQFRKASDNQFLHRRSLACRCVIHASINP